jgi:hypothetical protein
MMKAPNGSATDEEADMTISRDQRLVSFKPFSGCAARLTLLALAFHFTLP